MTTLWALTVLCMVFIVSAGIRLRNNARASAEMPKLFDGPEFKLIDQNGKLVTKDDLHGQPWICEFVFTRCTSICPAMLGRMAELQTTLDPRIRLVSFSVDPENDRPDVLKGRAQSLGADDKRWRFLTTQAGDKDGVRKVQQGMMLVRAGDPVTPSMHDNRFFLFDNGGHCVGIYTSADPADMTKLKADAASLLIGDQP
jgi:protein SCO1/2